MHCPSDPQPLTTRQRTVLFGVIDRFIASGAPVASAAVAETVEIEVSSATIRNVMAQLEKARLLFQPHTSAGRMPTAAGTRRYVNFLYDHSETLENPYRRQVDREFRDVGDRVDTMTRQAGELISRLSSLTSIVSMTNLQGVRLADIKLSLLGDRRVLVLLVADDERVYNRVVRMAAAVEAAVVDRIQNYLGELVAGHTLAQVRRRLVDERRVAEARYREFVRRALEIAQKLVDDGAVVDPAQPRVHVEGSLNILDHREFRDDVGRLRELLHALDQEDRVIALLEDVGRARQPQALIGPEIGGGLGDDLSLIYCNFYRRDQHMGVIGVLGPIRMDYARVIPLVDYAADVLTKQLEA